MLWKKCINVICLTAFFIGYLRHFCFAATSLPAVPLSEQDQLVSIILGEQEYPPENLRSGVVFRQLLINRFENYWAQYVEPEKKRVETDLQKYWQDVEEKCKQLAQTGKFPYSQTEADLLACFNKTDIPDGEEQSRLKNALDVKITDIISKFLYDDFGRFEHLAAECKKALDTEKLYSPTHYVCYHALRGELGVLNLVYQKIHNLQNLAGVHQLMLRFDTTINCFGAVDLNDFLDKTQKFKAPFYAQCSFGQGKWSQLPGGSGLFDHAGNIRAQLLSVNLSLFGSERVQGEATIQYFIQGGGVFSQREEEVLNGIFGKLGFNTKFVNKILMLFSKCTGSQMFNMLFQFLIDKKYVDEVLYLSHKGGKSIGLASDFSLNIGLGWRDLPLWLAWLRKNNEWDDTPNPDFPGPEEPRDRIKKISTFLDQCMMHPRELSVDAKGNSYSILAWKQARIWIPGLFKIPAHAYKINVYYNRPMQPKELTELEQGLDTIFHEIMQDQFIRMVVASGGFSKQQLPPSPLLQGTRLGLFYQTQMQGAVDRLKKFMEASSENERFKIASEQFDQQRRPSQPSLLGQIPVSYTIDKQQADLFALKVDVNNGEKFHEARTGAVQALKSPDTKVQILGLKVLQALVEQGQDLEIALAKAQEAITSDDRDVRNNARRLFDELFARGKGFVEAKKKAEELVPSEDSETSKMGRNFLLEIGRVYKARLCVTQQVVAREKYTKQDNFDPNFVQHQLALHLCR
ncbi:MAG: hypothetical protein WCW33_05710 [Candidatus Babeliales bacterium]|jgi:hypothetical protein